MDADGYLSLLQFSARELVARLLGREPSARQETVGRAAGKGKKGRRATDALEYKACACDRIAATRTVW
ncbi:MAG: hypothetical protein NTNFB02_20650 [Nitrospira sp.]